MLFYCCVRIQIEDVLSRAASMHALFSDRANGHSIDEARARCHPYEFDWRSTAECCCFMLRIAGRNLLSQKLGYRLCDQCSPCRKSCHGMSTMRIVVIDDVLRPSGDIGVCFYYSKVSAVVASTLQEWRRRISPYLHFYDEFSRLTEKPKDSRDYEVFEQFEK